MKRARPRPKRSKRQIHPLIKKRLGYPIDQPDAEVLSDWRSRLRRVCKPCWELKYCPYGPLVEQSPLLPISRSETDEHHNYLRECIRTGMIGKVTKIDDERRALYSDWLNDDELLAWQAAHELRAEDLREKITNSADPDAALADSLGGDLPPIHEYRVPYELPKKYDWERLNATQRKRLRKQIQKRKEHLETVLETGIEDNRERLDPRRRSYFKKTLAEYDPDQYPEHIPQIFTDGACNIFGHICPVFFAAEAMTETSTARRRGRYIPFAVKMRVVRRDNHTCQHCGKHLADTEVEFDHKIPISKGGSSEEHNVRLTCFDCNRDKKDKVEI